MSVVADSSFAASETSGKPFVPLQTVAGVGEAGREASQVCGVCISCLLRRAAHVRSALAERYFLATETLFHKASVEVLAISCNRSAMSAHFGEAPRPLAKFDFAAAVRL